MERRNTPHHSTADLLSWSEIRLPEHNRSNQLSDGISEALNGVKVTNEETESLNKNVSYRKNCSKHKLKEMVGSDIFSDNGDVDSHHASRIHYHQDQHSQISFSGEENASPKKPTTLTEAAKQKELSRTVETEADSKSKKKQIQKELSRTVETESDSKSKKKQISNSKTKAISGHDIFASPLPPTESQPCRSLAATTTQQEVTKESAPRNLRASAAKASNGKSGDKLFGEEVGVKSSKKKIHHNHKPQQVTSNGKLTSNGIFKCDKVPPGYSEKMHSSAKLQEMSGHNIFADGKSEYRDYYGGTRRPPGGESSISLV